MLSGKMRSACRIFCSACGKFCKHCRFSGIGRGKVVRGFNKNPKCTKFPLKGQKICFLPLCPTGISPAPGEKHRPECPNTGNAPQGNKQPDGNCSPKVGELPERVRGMNKRKANTSANIFLPLCPMGISPAPGEKCHPECLSANYTRLRAQ